ncbi:MAG TPA: ABC transporter substrate-binding protein [Pyrinomonadaceae bacterium]|nr:ABC transporter substrate-binding protein [Pyrinomonadaceae bacterium]
MLRRTLGKILTLRALAAVCVLALLGASCSGGIGGCAGGVPSPFASKDGRPARIVSLTPSVTEILDGVGAFDRVVAVSDYCTYPPGVTRLPRVGGWTNPNLERIASLRPDLVVYWGSQAQFVDDKLKALGIKTLSVPSRSLADAFAAIEQIGRATGNEEQARRLVEQTRAEIEEVRGRTSGLPRRSVLCVVDRMPGTLRDIYTAAEGSFLAELIEAAGGRPVSPPASTGWGKLQKEAVVSIDPDVIIDLMMQKPEGQLAEDTLAVWGEMPALRAVREGRVHPVRDETVLHPSQFVATTARKFAEIIHPEAFGK